MAGGRADLGILQVASQIQVSDNTDPTLFLEILEGFTHVFPANTLHAWVADSRAPHLSLTFRFHVGMCGILGIGSHLAHWTAEERAEAARCIALYKELRPLIQGGDLYWLRTPQAHPFSALMYVAPDQSEAVLFAFRTHLPPRHQQPPLYLRGLDPDARYEVEGVARVRSGRAWMHAGLTVELGDFESTVRRIRRVAP